MKLIHCSDLHLDSKMEALPPEKARERSSELRLGFERMVTWALDNGVSVIMIAGDMFDTERISPATVSFVLDVMRRAPEITFLYLRGNHDESRYAFIGQELPDNLKLFSDRWQSLDCGEAVISGVELTRDNCRDIYGELRLDPDRLNLVLLHGQTGTSPGEDTVALPLLCGKGIDYLALGHIHSFDGGELGTDGRWCYCGCLEGRGFDECGDKGFVLLDISGGLVDYSFIPFAKRRLHNIAVCITGLETVTELRDAMSSACEGIPSGDLVKFTLTGTFTPDTQKDLSFLRRAFEDSFYFVRIKDESRLALPSEDYMNDVSLKGEFIRSVMAAELEASEKEHIILLGLRALAGEEVEI
ncbi:MAG: metallophosphoesterase [Oscillospiraceae bacterium]|nr:metallophosphoesterase [Oscillospiraceae bacterium]